MTPHATHPDNGAVPTAPEVRTQLSAILASRAFSRSRRQSSFLSYLVEAALDGRQAEINEYSIARIYDRPESFDPAADSTVRVEARRLRARLAGYYEEEGREARVVIALPVGSYVPEFQYSQPAHPPAAPESAAEPQPARAAENRASRPFGKLALLGGASLIAVLAAFLMWRQPERGVRETRQITSFPGLQMQPALSPDRQQIAFVWDGPGGDNFDIYVKATWNHDLLRLTHDDARDQSPAWSRDGRSIAFLRALPGQRQAVMVIPAAGGTERSVATIQTGVAGIAWSADGNYLIVSDSPAGVSLGLFRVSVATGQMNPLTGYKGDFHPSLSANGKTLVFVRLDSGQPTATLCLLPVTADGLAAGPVEVLDLPQANEPMAGHDGPRFPRRETVGTPNWSSRGDALLFTRYTNDGNLISRFFPGRRHMEDLSELGLNASGLVEYASGHYVYTRRRISRFVATLRPGGGAKAEPLGPSQSDWNPEVSPDGKRIAMVSSRSGTPAIFITSATGEQARQIDVPGVIPMTPRWSADSTRIVFAAHKGASATLYTATVSGQVAEVPTGHRTLANPVFSRDGKWIYFSSDRSGPRQIWRVVASGGMPELLEQEPGSYVEEAPDGEALYIGNRGSIRRLTLVGRRTSTVLDGVCDALFRVYKSGIYALERAPSGRCTQIRVQPLATGTGTTIPIPTALTGMSLLPDGRLLLGLEVESSNIESARLH